MNDPIPWAEIPPPVPVASVWTPPPGASDLILLDKWYALWIHWCGRRSWPCLDQECPTSRHRQPQRWCGYAPAALARRQPSSGKTIIVWEPVVLPIGAECAQELREHLGTYPGPALHITRQPKMKQWAWEILWPKQIPDGLPPAFDPRPTLYRLWGIRPPQKIE